VENGKYSAKIRYRQADESCMVEIQESEISVTFERPQRAIAPGQFIVIYSGDHVI
jgi:tRNA-specific 2-thiouridylase